MNYLTATLRPYLQQIWRQLNPPEHTIRDTTLYINEQHLQQLRAELAKLLVEERVTSERITNLTQMIRISKSTSAEIVSNEEDIYQAYFDTFDTLTQAIDTAKTERTMFSILHAISVAQCVGQLDTERVRSMGFLSQNNIPRYEADLKSEQEVLHKLTTQKKILRSRIATLEQRRADLLGLSNDTCYAQVTVVTTDMIPVPATAPTVDAIFVPPPPPPAAVAPSNAETAEDINRINPTYPTLDDSAMHDEKMAILVGRHESKVPI